MIELQTLLLFSAASFDLAIMPGPDMLLVAARSAAQGRSAGVFTCGRLPVLRTHSSGHIREGFFF